MNKTEIRRPDISTTRGATEGNGPELCVQDRVHKAINEE